MTERSDEPEKSDLKWTEEADEHPLALESGKPAVGTYVVLGSWNAGIKVSLRKHGPFPNPQIYMAFQLL